MTGGYDCWQQVKTRNGYAADEVISALQKTIRRGETELAVRFGYEMCLTSEALEDCLWLRLNVICVEDIGFGAPELPILINALDDMRKKFPYGAPDRSLFMIHAVRSLCASKKTRSNDLLLNIVAREFARGILPEIPDYALDMHTARGQAAGRGLDHFLSEASRVSPPLSGEADAYKARLSALLAQARDAE